MARYRNGELLDEELPIKEETDGAALEGSGGTDLGRSNNGYAAFSNGSSNLIGTAGNTGAVKTVIGTARSGVDGMTELGATAAGQNTNQGANRTPLTYTRPDGTVAYDPRGASMVLTQFAQSQQDEPTLQESERTQAALQKLQEWENNRVAPFESRYDQQINEILNGLGNREGFSYNPEEDPLYKNYRDMYLRLGNRAMQDTMANAAGLTGGYGNTYATGAGQQAYQDYLSQLNAQLPGLYDRAYQRYTDEGSEMYNLLSALMSQDNTDYGRYRDTVGDWYTDRDYYTGRYDTETGNDFNRYAAELAQWQADRDFYYNLMRNGMVDDPITQAALAQYAGELDTGSTGGGGGYGSGNGGQTLSGKTGSTGNGVSSTWEGVPVTLGKAPYATSEQFNQNMANYLQNDPNAPDTAWNGIWRPGYNQDLTVRNLEAAVKAGLITQQQADAEIARGTAGYTTGMTGSGGTKSGSGSGSGTTGSGSKTGTTGGKTTGTTTGGKTTGTTGGTTGGYTGHGTTTGGKTTTGAGTITGGYNAVSDSQLEETLRKLGIAY